jgi:hypothetical protein
MEVEYTKNNDLDNCIIQQENHSTNINNLLDNNLEDEITLKSIKYDHIKKMEIKKKIEKIKKKEYLLDIFKIITSESRDYSENNNGVFIFFHDLSDEIYEKVENYVNNIYKLHKNNINNNSASIFNSDISESINDYSEKDNDKNLTNKEKMILRRKKYEEYLTHNQN